MDTNHPGKGNPTRWCRWNKPTQKMATKLNNFTSRQISTNPSYQNLLDILNLRSESVRVNGELNHLLN